MLQQLKDTDKKKKRQEKMGSGRPLQVETWLSLAAALCVYLVEFGPLQLSSLVRKLCILR